MQYSNVNSLVDVDIGRCSITTNIAKFRRGFDVFTMGLFRNVDLDKSKAVIAGGAVTACLLPWPTDAEHLWDYEQALKTELQNLFAAKRLPAEIANMIMEEARVIYAAELEVCILARFLLSSFLHDFDL